MRTRHNDGRRISYDAAVVMAIRCASVGLSYVMYVVIARHMSLESYGQFGVGLSLATFAGVIAVLGQHLLVFRYASMYLHDGDDAHLAGLLRYGHTAVAVGGLACAAIIAIVGIIWASQTSQAASYLLVAACLTIPLAGAQYQTYVMRSLGRVVSALLPRDVLWRISVICAVWLIWRGSRELTAWKALGICTITLTIIFLTQAFLFPQTNPVTLLRQPYKINRAKWDTDSKGLWANSIVQAAVPNLSVVLVGLSLEPALTGSFFAAAKTAALLNLPLAAGNIIGAPLIARYYHAGDHARVQRLSNLIILAMTGPVAIGFVLLVASGRDILGFFGPGYSAAYIPLLILGLGNLVNALSGSTNFLMNMTGHHREYLKILTISQAVALALLPAGAIYFSMTGAAIATALGSISWNVWVWQWARRNLRIDPTIVSGVEWLIRRIRQSKSTAV